MKKIINAPEAFVDEVVEGILLAHSDELRSASADNRALVRADAGTGGRAGIVTGGGSGHLPLFLGYVGVGLASGCAIGNVFSSPSPAQIHAATMASDDGAGVLYLYGNYGGDVYNFDIAAELAAADGVRTMTVLGTDDVLSAPAERAGERRGVAGIWFCYKCAGASAERGDPLEEVARIAQKAADRTRTMGVGLSPTILPAAGSPTFTLGEGEMEVGIGIHGEPGHHRGPIETADQITDRFLEEILGELDVSGQRVAVLVNGLGATPLEELYLIYRRVASVLAERGARVHRSYVGEYATSLEMAGASLSVIVLDDELSELIDAPCRSPFVQQGAVDVVRGGASEADGGSDGGGTAVVSGAVSGVDPGARAVRTLEKPGELRAVVLRLAEAMPAHAEELRELDAALGDGDLGITVSSGATAVGEAVSALPGNAHPAEILRAAGAAFASANPSTFAALVGGGLVAASVSVEDVTGFGRDEAATALRALTEKIQERGGAQRGDKTMLDVLFPVLEALEAGASGTEVVDMARTAVDDGAGMASRRGRAGWLGERSIGHRDPGSVAVMRAVSVVMGR